MAFSKFFDNPETSFLKFVVHAKPELQRNEPSPAPPPVLHGEFGGGWVEMPAGSGGMPAQIAMLLFSQPLADAVLFNAKAQRREEEKKNPFEKAMPKGRPPIDKCGAAVLN